jgi:hypothetical protein
MFGIGMSMSISVNSQYPTMQQTTSGSTTSTSYQQQLQQLQQKVQILKLQLQVMQLMSQLGSMAGNMCGTGSYSQMNPLMSGMMGMPQITGLGFQGMGGGMIGSPLAGSVNESIGLGLTGMGGGMIGSPFSDMSLGLGLQVWRRHDWQFHLTVMGMGLGSVVWEAHIGSPLAGMSG